MMNPAILAANPGLEAALNTDHYIVRDIAARFNKWGSISEKQIALVFKLAAEANKPAEAAAPTTVSEWRGTVKERSQFTLKLVKQVRLETQWGTSYLHIFTDEMGNNFKWFSSGGKLRNQAGNPIDLDAVVMVKATVKAHETYNGVKQTSLSRVALV